MWRLFVDLEPRLQFLGMTRNNWYPKIRWFRHENHQNHPKSIQRPWTNLQSWTVGPELTKSDQSPPPKKKKNAASIHGAWRKDPRALVPKRSPELPTRWPGGSAHGASPPWILGYPHRPKWLVNLVVLNVFNQLRSVISKWLAQLKKNELQMGSTELSGLILQVAGVKKVEWGVIAG